MTTILPLRPVNLDDLVDESRGSRLADSALWTAGAFPVALLISGLAVGLLAILYPLLVITLAVVQLRFLTRDGQTVGKKVLGIRIVRIDTGQNGGFVTNVLLCTVLNWILSGIPFYAAIDILHLQRRPALRPRPSRRDPCRQGCLRSVTQPRPSSGSPLSSAP